MGISNFFNIFISSFIVKLECPNIPIKYDSSSFFATSLVSFFKKSQAKAVPITYLCLIGNCKLPLFTISFKYSSPLMLNISYSFEFLERLLR